MIGHKLREHSLSLGRDFHADVFDVGDSPSFLALLCGGSGVTEEEYWKRGQTLVPRFDAALEKLEGEGLAFRFVYVSAPFGLPYNRFGEEPAAAETWCRFLREDVLARWPALPLYMMGYSGGAALAMAGVQADERCFGVGCLGADAVPADLEDGIGWLEPARLYYNAGDRVFDPNAEVVEALVADAVVTCVRRLPGGHKLEDYLANESFGGLIRAAGRLVGG